MSLIFYLPMCNRPNLFAKGWSSGSLSAGRFFPWYGIAVSICCAINPRFTAYWPILLNIANRKKKKEEERKSPRIILLYLAKQPQERSVAEWALGLFICEPLVFWGTGNWLWLIYPPHSGQTPEHSTTLFRTQQYHAQITPAQFLGWVRTRMVLNGPARKFGILFSIISRKMAIHSVCSRTPPPPY